jgi:hypothetical protein
MTSPFDMMYFTEKLLQERSMGLPVEEILKGKLTAFQQANYNYLCIHIPRALTPQECRQWIQDMNDKGYEPAGITVGNKQVVEKSERVSDRCYLDGDAKKLNLLHPLIQRFIPESDFRLNERLRCLRYTKGGFFKPHYDLGYDGYEGYDSTYTIQIYLNDGYEGGRLIFMGDGEIDPWMVPFEPKEGSIVIFDQRLKHQAELVTEGTKYTMRTDIMLPYTHDVKVEGSDYENEDADDEKETSCEVETSQNSSMSQ